MHFLLPLLLSTTTLAFPTPQLSSLIPSTGDSTSSSFLPSTSLLPSSSLLSSLIPSTGDSTSSSFLPSTSLLPSSSLLSSLIPGTGTGDSTSTSLLTTNIGSSTRNDIQSGVCAPITVIYARGTTETGNVGIVAGPPFFDALKKALGDVAVQGVAGFLEGGSSSGAKFMAEMVRTAMKACPTTKIVLSGYSQGAQVVHKAAGMLSEKEQKGVVGIVVFGDPEKGKAFPGALQGMEKTFCKDGDMICTGSPIIAAPHLLYGQDAEKAAEWVKGRVGK
ncbi:cutinase-domain-containing protein [Wilcoxina mikolae CBS 423.85]|nr:cutinase-domain-containing protein [Wilcoxina mikolae CBS 423.85]